MHNKPDQDLVIDFSAIVAECRRRSLITPAYETRVQKVVKHAHRVATSKAFDGLTAKAEAAGNGDIAQSLTGGTRVL